MTTAMPLDWNLVRRGVTDAFRSSLHCSVATLNEDGSPHLTTLLELAESNTVFLAGPLNFLDYWSDQTRQVFWRTLAAFSSGPGILVTDTPRETAASGLFRVPG